MSMETEQLQIQWYPGHMTKTRRMMESDLRLVDAVCEIVDARIPVSSRNPDLDSICGDKPRMIILNRIDMADPARTKQWAAWFKARGMAVIQTDCKSRKGITDFAPALRRLLADKLRRYAEKGMVGKPLKVMVVGIPNVGKSTFINQVAGRKGAKAENRPGVTRGKQWVTVDQGLLLLDTPGILWPKFEDPEVGVRLAFTGAVKDEVVQTEAVAYALCERLKRLYPSLLCQRYKLEPDFVADAEPYEIFEAVAKKRGLLLKGGEINVDRCSDLLLDEFRAGKIGKITLERPKNA